MNSALRRNAFFLSLKSYTVSLSLYLNEFLIFKPLNTWFEIFSILIQDKNEQKGRLKFRKTNPYLLIIKSFPLKTTKPINPKLLKFIRINSVKEKEEGFR